MSRNVFEPSLNGTLRGLLEIADECAAVGGGYRLRLRHTNATLSRVISAIEENPRMRFEITIDDPGSMKVIVEVKDTGCDAGYPPKQRPASSMRVVA
jgi:hypothetical protein